MNQEIRYSNEWSQTQKSDFDILRREMRMLTEELRPSPQRRTTLQYALRVIAIESASQTADAILRTAHKAKGPVLEMMLESLRGSLAKAKGQKGESSSHFEKSALPSGERSHSVVKRMDPIDSNEEWSA